MHEQKHINQSHPPFFIVGAQRSGSTLLRLILNRHSEVAIPEEARFLSPLFKIKEIAHPIKGIELKNLIAYLRANEQFMLWNYDQKQFLEELSKRNSIILKEFVHMMFASYATSEGKKRWGDKSLFFNKIDYLSLLFPKAQFIHIIRDGRDVFNSWRKMDKSKKHPAVMALDWNYKNFSIEKSFAHIPSEQCLVLLYEDLISKPKATVRSICDFLGLTYEPDMLKFYRSSARYIGSHHSNLIFQPIDNSNMNKWKKL